MTEVCVIPSSWVPEPVVTRQEPTRESREKTKNLALRILEKIGAFFSNIAHAVRWLFTPNAMARLEESSLQQMRSMAGGFFNPQEGDPKYDSD